MGPRWSGTSGGPSAKERALVEDARVAKANVARCKERIATHERTIASQQTLNVRLRERVDALESTVARILPKTSRETVLAELENARDAAATVKEAELRAARAGARLEAEIRARDAERRRMKHRALEVARERDAVGVRHHATLVRLRDVENEARFAAAEVRRLKAELDRPKPTRDVARDRSRARPVEDKSVDTADVVARRESIGEDEEEGADAVGGRVAAIRADVPAIVDWTPEPERVTVVIEVREPPPRRRRRRRRWSKNASCSASSSSIPNRRRRPLRPRWSPSPWMPDRRSRASPLASSKPASKPATSPW